MRTQSYKDRHFVLACFTVHLLEGNSLLGTTLRVNTVKGYLRAVDKLFADAELRLPFGAPPPLDLIAPLLTAQSRWEAQPERCEPISDLMFISIQREGQSAPQNSITAALSDWILLGRFTGHRKSEWSQDSKSSFATIPDHPDNPARAFVASDFVFLSHTKSPITHNHLTKSSPASVEITWRFQKNKNNGERIPFYADSANPELCPVAAAKRIIARAHRLRIPARHPIGVATVGNIIVYLTSSATTTYLRKVAKRVHPNLVPTDLKRWSSHSIRVSAAVALHRARFEDSYIQTRLRWKSQAFLCYLRNTHYTAEQHTLAVTMHKNVTPHDPRRSKYCRLSVTTNVPLARKSIFRSTQ